MHRRIDLKLITGFLAVVHHGSVTAAADHLIITQPALSRQVSELERRLNIRLFDRSPTRLRLTSAGQRFVPLAQDLLDRADSLDRMSQELARGELSRFHVVCPEATVRGVVAPFVAATGAGIEDTTLDIAARVYAHVQSRDADFAVNTLPPPVGLRSKLLGRVQVWAYFAPQHPIHTLASVTVTDLIGHSLIVLASGSGLRQTIDEALWSVRDAVTISAEPVSSDLALALAAAGRGVCLDLLRPSFPLSRRPLIAPNGSPVTLPLYAAWEADHFAGAEIAELADALTEWLNNEHDHEPA